jgi:phosphatidylglycerophosphatase C
MLNKFEKPVVVAAFDFDNTLTDQDSFLPFLFYSSGFWVTSFNLFLLMPIFIAFVVGCYPRAKVKEAILTQFFKGMPYKDLEKVGHQYATEKLDDYIKPIAMQKIQWHKEQGHFCVLISAAPEFYLKKWGERHGFSATLGTKVEVLPNGTLSGKLQGINCWGSEKVSRLNEIIGPKDYELYAYGDSEGDKELLALADYPFYRIFY